MGWNEEIKKELGYCGENVFIYPSKKTTTSLVS